MDSLKAELNTALQCDREAEEEVKKLKVGVSHPPACGELKSVGKLSDACLCTIDVL